MSTLAADPQALQWLDRHGAGAWVRELRPSLWLRLAFRFGGSVGRRMKAAHDGHLVGLAVLGELAQALHRGERMDPDGVRLAGAFVRATPGLLPALRAEGETFTDPNTREAWNTLLARIQATSTPEER